VPRNIRLVVEYDGTDLAGWQRQDNAPTVQEHVEAALAEMTQSAVTVTGASRTDAGVHALGQVCNFKTDADIPLHGFRRGLNGLLPESIAVVAADEVPADFNSRFSARGKHYRYTVLARPDRSPVLRRRAWHRSRPIDTAPMRAAAAHLVGEHDFTSFRAVGCSANSAVREITEVEISEGDPGEVVIDVRGNAFLRNMVRIVAGTLVEVGEGRRQASEIPEILTRRDRESAGQTAPARGLCLVQVFYL
jgi:tRNA pseudouridine38-40 synthase